MSGPAAYSAFVASGSPVSNLTSGAFTNFTIGQTLFFSVYYIATRTTGSSTDTITLNIKWYNAAGTQISTTTNTINVNGTVFNWVFFEGQHLAPANAVKGVAVITVTPVTTTQHNIWIAKVRLGKTAVGATVGADWASNLNNRPIELTDGRVPAGITSTGDLNRDILTGRANTSSLLRYTGGQLYSGDLNATFGAAWGANLSGRPANLSALNGSEGINNALVPMGSNRVVNSDLSKGSLGFGAGTATLGSGPIYSLAAAVNTLNPAYAGYRNVLQATVLTSGVNWTNTGSNYADAWWTKGGWNGGTVLDMQQYAMPVKPGDNVFARCLGAQHRCALQMFILFFDSTGAFNGQSLSWFGARDYALDGNAGHDGNPANFDQMGGTVTVPAGNAAFASLLFRMLPTGAGADPYIFVTEPMMGILAAGQTALPPYATGPTDSVLSVAGSNVRLGDQRNLQQIAAQNLTYRNTATVTFSSTAGSPATATVSVSASTSYIGSTSISYAAMSNSSITGAGGTSQVYYLYVDDPNFGGGTPPGGLKVTTDSNVIYQNNGRVYLGAVDVVFPTSGGSSGGGDSGGGTCVAKDSWVETQHRGFVRASEIVEGDYIRCLDEITMEGTVWLRVKSNKMAPQPAYRITSASGITLRLSSSTPLTLRDKSSIMVFELNGHELPVQDGEEFRWEACTAEFIGIEDVCYISLGGYVYAAGDVAGRSILTHNPVGSNPKP